MRTIRWMILGFFVLLLLVQPVFATEEDLLSGYTPEEGLTAEEQEQIGSYDPGLELSTRLEMLFSSVLKAIQPTVLTAIKSCFAILSITLLCGVLQLQDRIKKIVSLAGTLMIALICFARMRTMMELGVKTVQRMNEYALLLLPAMASLMSSGGAVSSAASSYTGATVFLEVMVTITAKLIVPLACLVFAAAAGEAALGNGSLAGLRDFLKWCATAVLKAVSYGFTGFFMISGVLSSASDSARLRAARIAISGSVPVVGGIVSDASGTVLATANLLKSSVGTYGMLGILSICLTPFFQLGVHYLLLKLTGALAGVLGTGEHAILLEHLASALGFLVSATGVCAVMLLLILGLCLKTVTV